MSKKVVWKYDVPIREHFTLELPLGTEILHFSLQYGEAKLWVLVDPLIFLTEEKVERKFLLAGTGRDINEGGLKYIGTIKMVEEKLIYHLFEY